MRAAGIEPVASHGGFFLMGRLPLREHLQPYTLARRGDTDPEPYDWRYCRALATDYGVIGIPASPFFSPGGVRPSRHASVPYVALQHSLEHSLEHSLGGGPVAHNASPCLCCVPRLGRRGAVRAVGAFRVLQAGRDVARRGGPTKGSGRGGTRHGMKKCFFEATFFATFLEMK